MYRPGEILECEYQIDAIEREELKSVEVSTLWYTTGKGDEEESIHFYERRTAKSSHDDSDLRQLAHFSTPLPPSPLSYSGTNLNIVWCVRIRIIVEYSDKDLKNSNTPSHSNYMPTNQASTTPNVNPFETRWIRPDSVDFLFCSGETQLPELLECMLNATQPCELIGDHGIGKTTLAYSLLQQARNLEIESYLIRCGKDGGSVDWREQFGFGEIAY